MPVTIRRLIHIAPGKQNSLPGRRRIQISLLIDQEDSNRRRFCRTEPYAKRIRKTFRLVSGNLKASERRCRQRTRCGELQRTGSTRRCRAQDRESEGGFSVKGDQPGRIRADQFASFQQPRNCQKEPFRARSRRKLSRWHGAHLSSFSRPVPGSSQAKPLQY